MSSIGIMDPAFFVGKVVLLKWLNEFFDAGYSKVEQTSTGAMHCQILDAVYPGKVPLGKVNFDAKNEYEFVANFKVLQTVFDAQQITKHVDVSKLVKGKFQDNLEMLQWMKHFFDTHYGGQPYDAKARREEAKAQYKKGHKHAGTGLKKPAAEDGGAAPVVRAAAAPKPAAATKTAASTPAVSKAAAPKPRSAAKTTTAKAPAASSSSDADTAALTEELSKLTLTIEGLERERNFYFSKLREIEILTADEEDGSTSSTAPPEVSEFKKKVLAILYATDENANFQTPADAAADGGEAGAEEAQPTEEELAAAEGLLGEDELQAE